MRILQKQSLDVHAKDIAVVSFENDFTEEAELFRNVGGNEQVELAQTERVRAALHVTSVEGQIAKAADLQESLGIHALRFDHLLGCGLGRYDRGRRPLRHHRGLCRRLMVAGLQLGDTTLKLFDAPQTRCRENWPSHMRCGAHREQT